MRPYLRNRNVAVSILMVLVILCLSVVSPSLAAPALQSTSDMVEPKAGTWKTWLMTSGSQFRLAAPPDDAATTAEIAQLKDMSAKRDAKALEQITYWDIGGPSYRWNEIAADEALKNNLGPNMAYRDLALLHAAIYDAIIAAWDTKYTFNRLRPSQVDTTLTTVIPNPQSPAYPSEYAVAAGAASTVLAYEFPDDAKSFMDQAAEATNSRLLAGVDYPSDVKAGFELGQKVGELAIQRGKADGSNAKWTGTVPTEKGKWTGTNPVLPMGGTWKTWVLTSGSQFRPDAPPAYDSDQEKKDLAELQGEKPTPKQIADAFFWQFGSGGTRAFWLWGERASKEILAYHLDSNPPRAARVYALENIGSYDATVACWDAKYTYWAIRPFQLDPTLKPLFSTPNHPSYPAAHSTISTASADVLAYLFPVDSAEFTTLANQAGESRILAGIHFRTDVVVGAKLGETVANAVISYAKSDGSG